MTHTRSPLSRLSALTAPALVAAALATVVPTTAQAWWRGGVVIGLPPVVIGPPAVAYPAPYYYPPYYPGYYAPAYPPPGGAVAPQATGPQAQQAPAQTPAPQLSQADTPMGSTCYAGFYVCAAPPQTHVGTGCSCPGLGAPSYGVVQ